MAIWLENLLEGNSKPARLGKIEYIYLPYYLYDRLITIISKAEKTGKGLCPICEALIINGELHDTCCPYSENWGLEP